MRRVCTFLNKIIVDLLRGKEDACWMVIILMFENYIVIAYLSWHWDSTDDFYLSAFVDKDVLRMYIPYFFLIHLKLIAGSDDVVKEVPNFSLKEILLKTETIVDLCLQHELIVIVA